MQTRTSRQRQSQSESSNAPTVQLSPRSWADPQQQPVNAASPDFSKLDLFSHAPQRGTGGSRTPIQAKLAIGKPNDQYEQEADLVADQVLSMPAPAPVQRQANPQQSESEIQAKPLAATITPVVQRTESAEAEEEEAVQGKFIQRMDAESGEAEEEELVQGKFIQRMDAESGEAEEEELMQGKFIQRMDAPHAAAPSLESQLHHSKGGGSPLPEEVRSFMEPRFGADFSQVRVHTDQTAVQMNRELGAQAFTHGNHIYYGADKTPATDQLTGHELTHTIQQGGATAAVQMAEAGDMIQMYPPRGLRETQHLQERMDERGITEEDVDDVVANSRKAYRDRATGSTVYYYNGIAVIVAGGSMVTTYRGAFKHWRWR